MQPRPSGSGWLLTLDVSCHRQQPPHPPGLCPFILSFVSLAPTHAPLPFTSIQPPPSQPSHNPTVITTATLPPCKNKCTLPFMVLDPSDSRATFELPYEDPQSRIPAFLSVDNKARMYVCRGSQTFNPHPHHSTLFQVFVKLPCPCQVRCPGNPERGFMKKLINTHTVILQK